MSDADHAYTVHYCVDYSDRPLCDPARCRHPGKMALPINMRIEPKKRGGNAIVMDGAICLDCGSDGTGRLRLKDGLTEAILAYGRIAPFNQRICALVEHRFQDLRQEPLPVWMAIALGMTAEQINAGQRRNQERVVSEYLARRKARAGGLAR